MPLPNFLIVGAQKSGTTSLGRYLERHPAIWVHQKELHFFSSDDRYTRGIEWYRDQFREADGQTLIGEKCPPYSAEPAPSERIHQHLPDAKIIWIFRNPVERAYSNYFHRIREGSERDSFETAIEKNIKRMEQGEDIHHSYVGLSMYAEHVRWFARYWPVESMHYLLMETFRKDTEDRLRGIFDFLGVEQPVTIDYPDKMYNRFFRPTSFPLQRWIYSKTGGGFGGHPKLFWMLSMLNRSPVRHYPSLDPEMRLKLMDLFKPMNRELADLTGLDITPWNKE